MKKLVIIIVQALICGVMFISCSDKAEKEDTTLNYDEGVMINGVIWATRNVYKSGTFTEKPEDTGNYFTWDEAKNVCPTDWRLPNGSELQSLYDAGSEWKTINGVNGRIFGSGDNIIFLPAGGKYWYGEYIEKNLSGSYWSSSPAGGWAMELYFTKDNASSYAGERNDKQNVRCVKVQ